ncbi:Uncharacterized protein Adt_41665 [Abeliophyllum distichum]|uniref:RNA polymerase alpha subunit n=1 Tax=Abeliophyllum distichum TaxID=126358 RepID=A0ABD1PPH3_9LAMI
MRGVDERGIEYINIFLHYCGEWNENHEYKNFKKAVILVPLECTFNNLVEEIYSELELNQTIMDITIQYQVKYSEPPIKIRTNKSLVFYLELKRKDKDFTSFPLCIDFSTVTASSGSSNLHQKLHLEKPATSTSSDMLQLQLYEINNSTIIAPLRLPTVEDIAYEVSHNVPEVDDVIMEAKTTIIFHPNVDKIERNQIY